MNTYRVSFIGHRELERELEIEARLEPLLTELLRTREYVEFQIGRNGDFDILVAACIKRMQKRYGNENSALSLVLPYPVAGLEFYEKYYDSVLIPPELAGVHPKGAITQRNRWLVENTDLLIAHVLRPTGGAATCLKMAQKANVKILRI